MTKKVGFVWRKRGTTEWKAIGIYSHKKPTKKDIKRWGYDWVLSKDYEVKIL